MSAPESRNGYLRAKIQIGNARGNISFGATQTVFHHDDINENKRIRKEEVKSWAKPSILAPKSQWNQTIVTNEPFMERRTTENFVHDRSRPFQYNYRAETLGPKLDKTPDKPTKFKVTLKNSGAASLQSTNGKPLYDSTIKDFKRTEEMPVHPNLESDFTRDWHLSTAIGKKQFRDGQNKLDDAAKKNSLKKTPKLVTSKTYQSPMQLSVALQEEVRKQKREGTFSLEKQIYQPPEPPVNRSSLVNRYAVEPDLKFRTTKHSGVWSLNKTEGR